MLLGRKTRDNTDSCHRLDRDKIGGLKPARVESEVERARSLLAELDSLLVPGGSGPWLFGLDKPTALDAHLVVFVGRLRDVGREILIPVGIGRYADTAMAKPEWKGVMKGRRTMIGV